MLVYIYVNYKKQFVQLKLKSMKNVLIIARLQTSIPTPDQVAVKNISIFGAVTLADVKRVFTDNEKKIDIVITGAGIELEDRLEIIKYIFETSDNVSVHMKDRASGQQGFLPFINQVLTGLLS